jgi:hypothetical protein
LEKKNENLLSKYIYLEPEFESQLKRKINAKKASPPFKKRVTALETAVFKLKAFVIDWLRLGLSVGRRRNCLTVI